MAVSDYFFSNSFLEIVNTIGTIDDLIEKYQEIIDKIMLFQLDLYNLHLCNDCSICTLENYVSFVNTGADAIQKAPIVDFNTGIKCVRVGDFTNNREELDWGYSNPTDEIFEQYRLKKGDILITRTASIGLSKLISEDTNSIYNNGIIRIKTNNKINPTLLYVITQTQDFIDYINGLKDASSTRPNMKIDYLLNYLVKLPKSQEDIDKLVLKLEKLQKSKTFTLRKIHMLRSIKKNLLSKYF